MSTQILKMKIHISFALIEKITPDLNSSYSKTPKTGTSRSFRTKIFLLEFILMTPLVFVLFSETFPPFVVSLTLFFHFTYQKDIYSSERLPGVVTNILFIVRVNTTRKSNARPQMF